LIDDKKKLSERCERLVGELKIIDKKSSDRLKSMEESHRIELQKLKDVHEAAEKLRRERWIDEKTKKIKELTVRGLEPEIQKLISKHKTELAKTKTIHEAELLAADERAAQRYVRMTEDLRDQLEREKESAIARERDSAREKYEKAIHDEEKSFVEQRRRLYMEIEDEKNRQADLAAKQRAELDK
jgi:5-azacytidine-induced protein 1